MWRGRATPEGGGLSRVRGRAGVEPGESETRNGRVGPGPRLLNSNRAGVVVDLPWAGLRSPNPRTLPFGEVEEDETNQVRAGAAATQPRKQPFPPNMGYVSPASTSTANHCSIAWPQKAGKVEYWDASAPGRSHRDRRHQGQSRPGLSVRFRRARPLRCYGRIPDLLPAQRERTTQTRHTADIVREVFAVLERMIF